MPFDGNDHDSLNIFISSALVSVDIKAANLCAFDFLPFHVTNQLTDGPTCDTVYITQQL